MDTTRTRATYYEKVILKQVFGNKKLVQTWRANLNALAKDESDHVWLEFCVWLFFACGPFVALILG